jgi:hypothetical protein
MLFCEGVFKGKFGAVGISNDKLAADSDFVA